MPLLLQLLQLQQLLSDNGGGCKRLLAFQSLVALNSEV